MSSDMSKIYKSEHHIHITHILKVRKKSIGNSLYITNSYLVRKSNLIVVRKMNKILETNIQ
jgi:hypothetical protein